MTYDMIKSCFQQVRSRTDFIPEYALVLGSGLGDFADQIQVEGELSYREIKGFPVSTAPGHEGKYIYGMLDGHKVICMKGRVHLYEGYTPEQVVLPIRVMRMMGAQKLILTNSSGAVSDRLTTGDFMLITDHISAFVRNPLIGPNMDAFGGRFTDLSKPYDEALCEAARKAAKDQGILLKEGVYLQLTGPSYESLAEDRMFRLMGVDAVGMSTVAEVIAARHAGMRVCALSYVSAVAADLEGEVANEQGVLDSAVRSVGDLGKLIRGILANGSNLRD